ncbi:hypothetical protein ACFU6R_02395 [Streptomyces sp. NPDC057499]|uniref:hypothetical protein n=1 Tax=Streptomyces sp. NPDC057499 TaxID=3346150 RepID=UPI00369023D8
MAEALPLVHGLLDEAVRLLSEAVREFGTVVNESFDALTGAAGTFGRVRPGEQSQNEIPAGSE